MKYTKYIYLLLVAIVVATTPFAAYGQGGRNIPDAKILFRINSAVVDESFSDNDKTIKRLDHILLNQEHQHKIKHIDVVSSSSIDGNYDLNRRLSQRRINAVRAFLINRYPSASQSMFKYVVVGENWSDLRACVVADTKVPYRRRVLAVIDNKSVHDRKEVELKNIEYGASWNYLKEHIFPQQRYGVGIMVVLKDEYRNEKLTLEPEPKSEPKSEPEPKAEPKAEPAPAPEPTPEPIAEQKPTEVITPQKENEKILIALKTNLLADAVTALNFEIEVPIGNKYSVATEFKFPWWRGVGSDLTMQILSGHIEGKYWLGERTKENRLLGFSVGAFTGFGTYDIQLFRTSGISGDFFELGVMAGYSHSIYKNLKLEYEMGLGYIHSGYRRYDMSDVEGLGYVKVVRDEYANGKLYTNTFLPTRFKVSLVWDFGLPQFWR